MKPTALPDTRASLKVGDQSYTLYTPEKLEGVDRAALSRRPIIHRILIENLLRNAGRNAIDPAWVRDLANGVKLSADVELPFYPARILLQDFTGVPVVVDLTSMRTAAKRMGLDPAKVDSHVPIDLVIDHSIQVDRYGTKDSLAWNLEKEYARNAERYAFLKWAQGAYPRLRVIPPGNGICHQVNMEFLATVVEARPRNGAHPDTGEELEAFPDTVLGTDSHTTMVNGVGVLGWGVGGIEAEAVMLGEPYFLGYPEVIGMRLDGTPKEGVTATDVVLRITQILRRAGVVGKFVEFYGPGLGHLSVPERATLSNMCPEYGATAALFPIDEATLSYLRTTGRSEEVVSRVGAYAKAQGLWRDGHSQAPEVAKELQIDLSGVEPTMSGPKNPEEAHSLSEVPGSFQEALESYRRDHPAKGTSRGIPDGSIAVAAITSCTNTSNPLVMVGAGLLAKHAIERGLKVPPHVKTSMAPGSRVVAEYLERGGLLRPLEGVGFAVVGYGCTTCIGNSGPLPTAAEEAVRTNDAFLVAVLSGNRNFEARIHNQVRANYLASPPLVVAAALAGRIDIDLSKDPLGTDPQGRPVRLKDIWPTSAEIRAILEKVMDPKIYQASYGRILDGGHLWDGLGSLGGLLYPWGKDSTYLREAPYFDALVAGASGMTGDLDPAGGSAWAGFPHVGSPPVAEIGPTPPVVHAVTPIHAPETLRRSSMRAPPAISGDGNLVMGARVLALLGDNVSTDHISPAGEIPATTPAGRYLTAHGVPEEEFNTYGARRGNHEVMVRGTFANPRLKNYLAPAAGGGLTTHMPSGREMAIFDASELYRKENRSLIVIGGERYGQGSSRDWAAKGPLLLGVRAVIAQSFERIHRSNLAGMGVLPLEFRRGEGWKSLGLTGWETYTLSLKGGTLVPHAAVGVQAIPDALPDPSKTTRFEVTLRLDSAVEIEYYRHGGLLPYAMGRLFSAK